MSELNDKFESPYMQKVQSHVYANRLSMDLRKPIDSPMQERKQSDMLAELPRVDTNTEDG